MRTAKEWIEEGHRLIDEKQYEGAREAFQSAIDRDASLSEAWRGRALALWYLHADATRCLKDVLKALDLNPENAKAWDNKGFYLLKLCQYEEAVAAYERAIALDPELAYAHHNRGDALDELGQYEKALAAYDEALVLDPELAYAHRGRGSALYELGQYEEAVAAYDEALALDPEYANAYNGRGNALDDLGRYEEAVAAYEAAIALDPEYISAHNDRGNALQKLGRHEEALAAYEAAIALDPELANAYNGRGGTLYKLGQHEEALTAFRTACRLALENPMYWLNRRTAANGVGNRSEAHRCRLRMVDLSRHAARLNDRRKAIKYVPTIIQTLATKQVAPMLLARLADQDGFENAFLQNAGAVARARKACAPYEVLRAYYALIDADPVRRHRILGTLALALGDPFVAIDHFAQLDLPERDELHAARRMATCHEEIFREDEEIEDTMEDGVEVADALLAALNSPDASDETWAEYTGGSLAESLYDAGHLYMMMDPAPWAKARSAFRQAAKQGHLPSAYMHAWTALQDPDTTEAEVDAAAALALDLEEEHEEIPPAPDAREAVDEAVSWVEDRIVQAVQRVETQEARQYVLEWADLSGRTVDIPTGSVGIALGDEVLRAVRDATRKTAAMDALVQNIDEKRAELADEDVATLRTRLDNYENLPTGMLDGQGRPEARAETLGERIQNDRTRKHQEKHRDIWIYLTLTGRISPQHALSLSAYLSLADHHAPQSDVLEKSVDLGITDAVLSAGAVQGLQLAGVSLAAFSGTLQIGLAAAACCFAKTMIRKYTGPTLPTYPDFHDAFYNDLEGQADAVYDQVQAFLSEISTSHVSVQAH